MRDLIGNERARSYLEQMVSTGHIGQSLLLAGPPGVGKSLFAIELAKLVMGPNHHHKITSGNHPDLHIYHPEGRTGMLSIESLRTLSREVYLEPNEAPYKVFIIEEADRMPPASANALLKTFEEPADHTLIILISSNRQAMLPTILSRCRTLYFEPISERDVARYLQKRDGLDESEAHHYARAARGSLARALRLVERKGETAREALLAALGEGGFRDFHDLSHSCEQIASALESERSALAASFPKPDRQLSAKQRESHDKKIEGAVAVEFARELDALYDDIALWYRDLHLLKDDGDIRHIYHREHVPHLEKWALPVPPLETVHTALADSRLAVERFSKLSHCLETLFLRLGS